jgi:transposase-like protein
VNDYPQTLFEFDDMFATEAACLNYVLRLRWPEGFICPRCGHEKGWMSARGLFVCSACAYQVSVKVGTIFQDSRKPLTMWFRAAWWITSQKTGASALNLQKILGLGSYETAWTWLHKFRRAMVRPDRDRLSGRVDVDETYWGAQAHGMTGRGAQNKTLIAVASQEDGNKIGRIRLRRITNASAEELMGFIQEAIEPGSTVCTDGWKGYASVESHGYAHEIQLARHQKEIGEDLLPRVHKVVSLLKRWMLGTHQGAISDKHLDYYLDEFTFRFNRRTSQHRGKLFYRLMQQAMVTGPVPYDFLIKDKVQDIVPT